MDRAVRRQAAFAFIVILLAVVLLETTARLIEAYVLTSIGQAAPRPGWQTEFFGGLFDWHEPDPDLLWRFKADLNNPLILTSADHMLGSKITTGKPADTYRVLILGDSSPVGLGLSSRRQTFGEILRYLLDRRYAGRKTIEVLNAAVSGYTSEQIVRLLTIKGWKYDPDLIILYCGNNDASISGVYSDRELLQSQRLTSVRKILSHLALYRILCGLLVGRLSADQSGCGDLKVRVSPEDFGANLEAIAGQCIERHCPLIILKPPVPYLWPAGLQFKPFLHVTGEDGRMIMPEQMADLVGRHVAYCVKEEWFTSIFNTGDAFTHEVFRSAYVDTADPEGAIRRYMDRLAIDPENPVLLNNLGVACWKDRQYREAEHYLRRARTSFLRLHGITVSPAIAAAGSPILYNLGVALLSSDSLRQPYEYDTADAAFAFLDSALQADYFSLRIKKAYWQEIDRFTGNGRVAVIDLPAIFNRDDRERLFTDHCHPNSRGHLLIAEAVYHTIIERHW